MGLRTKAKNIHERNFRNFQPQETLQISVEANDIMRHKETNSQGVMTITSVDVF